VRRGALLALIAASLLLGTPDGSGAAGLLYPDLRPQAPRQLRFAQEPIDGTTHHVLRFTATIWNAGEGPLELRGDSSTGQTWVYQRVFDAAGAVDERPVGEFIYHEAHNHWHFENFAGYELWTRADYDRWLASGRAQGTPLRSGSKTTGQGESFCIRDSRRVEALPGGPGEKTYSTCDRDLQGISVGWGDTYQHYLPEQWVDLGEAPLPDGRYVLRAVADPFNLLFESEGRADPDRESVLANEAVTFFTVRGDRISTQRQ
jgi:hypothetical protein